MPRTGKNLKTRLAVSSFLLFFLSASAAQAELKLFPMWERMKCSTGEFACYTFEQSKNILKLDIDLQLKLNRYEACKAAKIDLTGAIEKLQESLILEGGVTNRLETRLKEKDLLLEDTTDKWLKAEDRTVVKWLPWIIGGILVVGAGTFVTGWYIGSR